MTLPSDTIISRTSGRNAMDLYLIENLCSGICVAVECTTVELYEYDEKIWPKMSLFGSTHCPNKHQHGYSIDTFALPFQGTPTETHILPLFLSNFKNIIYKHI